MRAMVAGDRAPQPRAACRHDRCQKEADERALALTGPWREEPLCGLTHALALCACSTPPRRACEAQLARAFAVSTPRCEPSGEASAPGPRAPPPRRTPHSQSQNAPAGNTRAHRLRIPGVALVAVHGMSDALAQTLVAELGTDMSPWPDANHFGSWRGLAPKNDISGRQVLKRRTLKKRHRAAQACRLAAPSVPRFPCALGACSRRRNGRRGPAQAVVATAHKSARTV
jgi:transposase